MSERLCCDLCGREDHDVKVRLVRWADAVVEAARQPPWENVARCPDYQACRARVESKGERWPIRDTVTQPTVTKPQQREEVPV